MTTLYPVNVIDFQDMFPTDTACHDYLCLVRWSHGFVCPNCAHTKAYRLKSGLRRCQHCRKDISVTAGTVFQDRRIPLRLLFQAIWYIVCQKNGVSALGLQSILGVGSYRTAWSWLHKLRTAMVRPGRERLSGTVEVDETLVGGTHVGKRGRGAQWRELVLVAVEDLSGTKDKSGNLIQKGIGRIRLKHIPNASSKTLEIAVDEMIAPGSIVRTDGWRGYNGLKEKGYTHIVIAHNTQDPGEDPTPLVHRIASLLKRWLLGTHQGAQNFSHLHYYLDEFTFRFNRRKATSRGLLFLRLIQQALQVDPAPIETINASIS